MKIIGRIIGINTSDSMINLLVTDKNNEAYNIKTKLDSSVFKINNVYEFDVEEVTRERVSYFLVSYQLIESTSSNDGILRDFYKEAPLSLEEAKHIIEDKISQIENPVIHQITEQLLKEHQEAYFVFPAATKMHHTYVGGLAYHTVGMLSMADSFLLNYPFLKKDYLYAGIILHDIGKISELTGIQAPEYTLDGQLLGHLVIGAMEIQRVALALGLDQTKEAKLLQHMLISHHGQPQFGAAKRPMTPEAIALWYIDTIDSKFRVLGEVLEATEAEHFTETIGVLEKIKVYKVS